MPPAEDFAPRAGDFVRARDLVRFVPSAVGVVSVLARSISITDTGGGAGRSTIRVTTTLTTAVSAIVQRMISGRNLIAGQAWCAAGQKA